MKTILFFFSALLLLCAPLRAQPNDLNALVLEKVREMPTGGKYSTARVATIALQSAAHFEQGKFFVLPPPSSPSFCSGATYLVFLKTIEELRRKDLLTLDYDTLMGL